MRDLRLLGVRLNVRERQPLAANSTARSSVASSAIGPRLRTVIPDPGAVLVVLNMNSWYCEISSGHCNYIPRPTHNITRGLISCRDIAAALGGFNAKN